MGGIDEVRARHALEGAGLDIHLPLDRASSVTNEVWIAPDHVIRVNRQPNQRLRREALLAPDLPSEIGYPSVVAYGGELGADWLVTKRLPGLALSRCWPTMAAAERRSATEQLAERLKALHAVECPADLPGIRAPHMLGGPDVFNPVEPLLAGLHQASAMEHLDDGLVKTLERIVRESATSLDDWHSPRLVHGDLHFENVLWDGEQVTGLLDFEFARPGPADLDLDVLLRMCAMPFLHVAPDYEHLSRPEDYEQVPWWLADAYPELFAHPRQLERVRLYCIAFDVRQLLDDPPTRRARDLSPHHALNRLLATTRSDSHLDRLSAGGKMAG